MTDDVAVSTEIQVDDETRAALLLFNERVEATAAQERGAKRLAKAERAKDEAAATVRKLNDDPNAKAEEKSAAEAAYKEAVASYNTIKDDPLAGETPRKPKASEPERPEQPEEAPAEDEPSEISADEEPTETSADEEPAPETPAETAAAAAGEPDESE